jgi:Zinc carboxypeptidase
VEWTEPRHYPPLRPTLPNLRIHRLSTQLLVVALLAVAVVCMLATVAHAAVTTAAYRAVGPTRVADTRPTSSRGFTPIDAHTIRVVVDADALAATLTVTAVDASGPGFITVWPTGAPRPEVSNLNLTRAGEVRANTVTVRLGTAGSVDLFVQTPTQLIVDVVGLFTEAGDARAGRYQPSHAGRVLDTREPAFGAAPLKPGRQRDVPLPADMPSDTIAVAANLTFTGTLGAGFFTAWPAGTPLPQASTGNADGAGQTRAIFTLIPVSASGFSIYTQGGAHVVVDIVGSFTGPSAPVSNVGLFEPQDPTRLLDTRSGHPGIVWPGGSIELPIAVDGHAAAWLNYTTTDAFAAGYMTAWPARTPQPTTSSLNAPAAGATIANSAITNLSAAGIALASFAGENLLADLAGYFTGPAEVATTSPQSNDPPATFTFGSSADGRALVATHRQGSSAPTRNVLVIGSMHGEEPAGARVVDALAAATLPPDLELWTVRTMNPDGLATGTRRNGHDVDLNRNWPGSLYPAVATSGSGPYPLSEPENQAMVRLVSAIHNRHGLDWAISYHQPLSTVDCDPARGPQLMSVCSTFSKATDIPLQSFLRIPGTMTDTMNGLGNGRWFTVEFGAAQPTDIEVSRHARAISVIGR